MFLQLAKENPGRMLVPTLDIDLIWHVHMLSPQDYHDDCLDLLGRPLSHDATVKQGALKQGFNDTKRLWKDAYGCVMVETLEERRKKEAALRERKLQDKNRNDSGYVGCGSCGWGDELFHSNLPHKKDEDAMIEESGHRANEAAAEDYGEESEKELNSSDTTDDCWADPSVGASNRSFGLEESDWADDAFLFPDKKDDEEEREIGWVDWPGL